MRNQQRVTKTVKVLDHDRWSTKSERAILILALFLLFLLKRRWIINYKGTRNVYRTRFGMLKGAPSHFSWSFNNTDNMHLHGEINILHFFKS